MSEPSATKRGLVDMGCGSQQSARVGATHCWERAKGDREGVARDEVLPQRGREGCRREGEGEVHLGGQELKADKNRWRWRVLRKRKV